MSATLAAPKAPAQEQSLILPGIRWQQYVTIADALPERHGLKLVFVDGRLTFLTTSRKHDYLAERLGNLVQTVANGLGIVWEDSGQATYRREDVGAGVEPDRAFYFGEHAVLMRGPQNIDLATQPPPDLTIEVEVTHPADEAMKAYRLLGVPEVWRLDVGRWSLGFWALGDDGRYAPRPRSLALPPLEPNDVLDQLRLAEEIGASAWLARLGDWVQNTLVPRNVDPA